MIMLCLTFTYIHKSQGERTVCNCEQSRVTRCQNCWSNHCSQLTRRFFRTYHGTWWVDMKIFCPQDPRRFNHLPLTSSWVKRRHFSAQRCAALAAPLCQFCNINNMSWCRVWAINQIAAYPGAETQVNMYT